eukprot:scaffold764_cov408-Prasinococcus_capsulatus_cf.AAC.13
MGLCTGRRTCRAWVARSSSAQLAHAPALPRAPTLVVGPLPVRRPIVSHATFPCRPPESLPTPGAEPRRRAVHAKAWLRRG